ncbi:type IV secretory system conjugative DNA transfer family protein [Streptomyces sp. DW26H14]|uniref:type IV secretory system conjugative DNA transfer family protein n=1 Tax=Streptomyces sp. DW26H14 TaxID=3435395 RepID=UPI00403DD370
MDPRDDWQDRSDPSYRSDQSDWADRPDASYRSARGKSGGARPGAGRQGGIPDGLLLGLIGFLLGLAVLVWTATGLGGLFTHGSWPDGLAFTRTPTAIRALVTRPHDLAGAWPATPPHQLSGYGLFWGLLISQLMVLTVLTVFTLGTVTRWRAVRAARRERARRLAYARTHGPDPAATTPPTTTPQPQAQPEPQPHPQPQNTPQPSPARPSPPLPALEHPTAVPAPGPPTPESPAADHQPPAVPAVPLPGQRASRQVQYGDVAARRPTATAAIRDAEGPVLVITSDPAVWSETKDARAKLGPVLIYDPGHLCETPARLRWSPTAGCEDPASAADRALALLAPVRPHAALDAAMADTAETLLRCWLHAAAVDGRPFRQVHRWAQGSAAQDAVRVLRTHPKAAAGYAGLLESALTAHPERRDAAQQLTARALASLSSVHIRDAVTFNRTDAVSLGSFAAEGGTLYVVGEPIEDPRSQPGAMPLLTALASHVVEHGRRMAARSPDGRLDPPMSLVLDDVAAVAPLPALPDLLSSGDAQGLPTLALLRSREQGRARWPRHTFTDAP